MVKKNLHSFKGCGVERLSPAGGKYKGGLFTWNGEHGYSYPKSAFFIRVHLCSSVAIIFPAPSLIEL